jgi:hypothetical protein
VSGTASTVSVTYTTAGGDTAQQNGVQVPWSHSVGGGSDFLYISAQNQGEAGNVTCTIRNNGTAVKQTTSTGAYAICTASLPN